MSPIPIPGAEPSDSAASLPQSVASPTVTASTRPSITPLQDSHSTVSPPGIVRTGSWPMLTRVLSMTGLVRSQTTPTEFPSFATGKGPLCTLRAALAANGSATFATDELAGSALPRGRVSLRWVSNESSIKPMERLHARHELERHLTQAIRALPRTTKESVACLLGEDTLDRLKDTNVGPLTAEYVHGVIDRLEPLLERYAEGPPAHREHAHDGVQALVAFAQGVHTDSFIGALTKPDGTSRFESHLGNPWLNETCLARYAVARHLKRMGEAAALDPTSETTAAVKLQVRLMENTTQPLTAATLVCAVETVTKLLSNPAPGKHDMALSIEQMLLHSATRPTLALLRGMAETLRDDPAPAMLAAATHQIARIRLTVQSMSAMSQAALSRAMVTELGPVERHPWTRPGDRIHETLASKTAGGTLVWVPFWKPVKDGHDIVCVEQLSQCFHAALRSVEVVWSRQAAQERWTWLAGIGDGDSIASERALGMAENVLDPDDRPAALMNHIQWLALQASTKPPATRTPSAQPPASPSPLVVGFRYFLARLDYATRTHVEKATRTNEHHLQEQR